MKQVPKVGATVNMNHVAHVNINRGFYNYIEPEVSAWFLTLNNRPKYALHKYDELIKLIKENAFSTPLPLGEDNFFARFRAFYIHAAHDYEASIKSLNPSFSTIEQGEIPHTPWYGIKSTGTQAIRVNDTSGAALVHGQYMVDSVNQSSVYGCGGVDNLNRGRRISYDSNSTILVKEGITKTSASYSGIPRHSVGWKYDLTNTSGGQAFVNGTSIGSSASSAATRGEEKLWGICAQYIGASSPVFANFFTSGHLGLSYTMDDVTNFSFSEMHNVLKYWLSNLGIPNLT